MKARLIAIAALVALCGGLFVAPAAAETSTTTSVVNDEGTGNPWSGTEEFGASADDTAVVTPDVSAPSGGTLTYLLFSDGTCDGTLFSTQTVNLNDDGTVPNSDPTGTLDAGTYSFEATYNGDGINDSSPGVCESFTIAPATPTTPTVSNLPTNPTWSSGGGFTAVLGATDSDGAQSVTSSTTDVCTTSGLAVTYLTAGQCTLTAQTAASTNYAAASGSPQTFTIAAATPTTPTVSNLPTNPTWSSGGGFTAVLGATDSDGAQSVTSSTTDVCTTSGLAVTYLTAGQCTLTAQTAASTNYAAASGSPQTFTIAAATPTTPTVSNLPTNPTWSSGGGFTAVLGATDSDGAQSVTSSTTDVCTTSGLAVTYLTAGQCTLTAQTAASTNYAAASGSPQTFTIVQAAPTAPTISNLPGSGAYLGAFKATVSTTGDGTTSVTTNSPSICTVGSDGLTVTYVHVGSCSLTAHIATGTDYTAADGSAESFTVFPATASAPSMTNLPHGATFGGSFVPTINTNGDGTKSVTSNSTGVCIVGANGLTVSFLGVGICSLTSHVAAGTNYAAADGPAQTFNVGRATPSSPVIANIPAGATEFGSFVAAVASSGDGKGSVTSGSNGVCTVGPDGVTVTFVGFGTCTLTASVAQGAHYLGLIGSSQAFPVNPAARGYWLVGSDGGIFSFGAAGFHGSMGGIPLQRPVVGITPTSSRRGYWLVASDGGIFSFGDSSYYGSIPGVGLHPAGSGLPNSLDAPIVGMVPSTSGHGYFMVATDGGVFAFGDARFEGSCPGIGGCDGAAVAVMPDSTGNGYWLVTNVGAVYAFGDAPFYGAAFGGSGAVVDAVATPGGHGYWVLHANGGVLGFGDAVGMGAPLGYVNSFNPAAGIFPTADGKGYWVAAARGDVFAYGDAPYMGSMAAAGLNGLIIAGFGF